jgi:hypothetical protein
MARFRWLQLSTGELVRRLFLLILLMAAPAFAQTNFGGYIAPPPRPSVSGSNLATNPGFTSGTTGYTSVLSCGAVVADANAPSGSAFQLRGVNSGGTCNIGGATVVFEIEAGANGNSSFGSHDGEYFSIEISTSSTFNGRSRIRCFAPQEARPGAPRAGSSALLALGRTTLPIQ